MNQGDHRHRIQFTVRTPDGAEIDSRTAEIDPDEQRRFGLDIADSGVYPVAVTGDGELKGTWSINVEEYDINDGSNVILEIADGQPDIYWEE